VASWQLVLKPFCSYLSYVPRHRIWKPPRIVGIGGKKLGDTLACLALITFHECSKGHITCPMTCYIPLIPITCTTWTQNVFRYHKVKINGVEGRLSEKIVTIFFELIAFAILGQFNIF